MKRIPLSKGKFTLVDDADFWWLAEMRWNVFLRRERRVLYATRGQDTVFMHRLIIQAPKGTYVDHIDGDGLNNQRANLRLCTNSENLLNRTHNQINNTSGANGVYIAKRDGHIYAKVKINGRQRYIGSFPSVDAATAARNTYLEKLGLLPPGQVT